jgi:hypothetical protein
MSHSSVTGIFSFSMSQRGCSAVRNQICICSVCGSNIRQPVDRLHLPLGALPFCHGWPRASLGLPLWNWSHSPRRSPTCKQGCGVVLFVSFRQYPLLHMSGQGNSGLPIPHTIRALAPTLHDEVQLDAGNLRSHGLVVVTPHGLWGIVTSHSRGTSLTRDNLSLNQKSGYDW